MFSEKFSFFFQSHAYIYIEICVALNQYLCWTVCFPASVLELFVFSLFHAGVVRGIGVAWAHSGIYNANLLMRALFFALFCVVVDWKNGSFNKITCDCLLLSLRFIIYVRMEYVKVDRKENIKRRALQMNNKMARTNDDEKSLRWKFQIWAIFHLYLCNAISRHKNILENT